VFLDFLELYQANLGNYRRKSPVALVHRDCFYLNSISLAGLLPKTEDSHGGDAAGQEDVQAHVFAQILCVLADQTRCAPVTEAALI
jgi:hypothetical protein